MAAWKNPVSGDWDVASNWSTDTVPTSGEGVNILAPGAYIVTISSPVQAAELFFDSPQAQLVENSGSLTLIGTLSVVSGFVSLNEANTLDFNLAASVGGGVLAFGSGAALGSGTVSLFGGELLASKDETLTNALNIFDTSTIAATHGTTLIEDASSVTIRSNSTLNIGSPGEDGTILWRTNGASSVSSPATDAVHVQAGTLKALDANFSELVERRPDHRQRRRDDRPRGLRCHHLWSLGRRHSHRPRRRSDFDARRDEFLGHDLRRPVGRL